MVLVMTDPDAFDCDLYRALPQRDALRRYVEQGYPLNHFLAAVVSNDLMEAVARADDANLDALEAYVAWLRTHAPAASYGSTDKMRAWIAQRGLAGNQ